MLDKQLHRVKAVMECGHVSNALYDAPDGSREPICALCRQTEPIKSRTKVDLSGRVARCVYSCGAAQPSSPSLQDFKYLPDKEYDTFYNGCKDLRLGGV